MSTEINTEIVIFDIDGTLADISQRRYHLEKYPQDWDAFFQDMKQDKAIVPMVRLCNTLYQAGFKIVLCTGRPAKYQSETIAWLANYGVKYHKLFLRADGDRRSDAVIKREMLAKLDRAAIAFVVEDRSRTVDMWRSEGLICLQCAPGDF
ncbi:MAG: HAD family acid phosphatase [Acidobacteriota bacterium]